MSPADAVIRLEQVRREFRIGEQTVLGLDDVSLRVEAGEYLSVMGPSGSGKSTLLNVLGLLDTTDSGHYFLAGHDTATLNDDERARLRQRYIGFVFQAYHLVPRLNARENIELPLLLAGVPAAERRRRSERALEQFGLAERAHHLPNQLSGGQRQRVAIARAIIMQPQLLLADEPTGNLDSQSGQDVTRLLEQLNSEGQTLVIVTHDPALGERARRRLHLRDGRIHDDRRG